jgi:predicted lipoprotein with Yx(FWY)xxD motif
MPRATRPLGLFAIVILAGCTASGGGAGSASSPTDAGAASLTVEAAETDAGTSLVDADGMTLYIFTNDTDGTSTCYDDCATAWPPFTVEGETTLEGGDGVDGELATTERDDGTQQVTYDGMPLYTFASDTAAGDATGEGVGGVWFIAAPEGHDMGSHGGEGSDEASPTEDDDYDY